MMTEEQIDENCHLIGDLIERMISEILHRRLNRILSIEFAANQDYSFVKWYVYSIHTIQYRKSIIIGK